MMGQIIEEEKRQLSDYIKHYRPKQILRDRLMEGIIFLGGLSAIIFTVGIFLFVIKEAWPFLTSRFSPIEFLTNIEWYPDSGVKVRYGASALFIGTAAVTIGSMILAIPVGLGTAIFISEFCRPRFKEIAKIVIELLASIPSVVWGFIAIMVVNPFIINVMHQPVGLNVFNASIILALMSIPMIVSIGEDALRSVPDTYREAAESMGATRLEVVWRVIIPAAKNGLIAATLLGVGRSVGETMAVLMATGHSVAIPDSLFSPVRTLTATVAAEMGESPKGSEHYQALFAIGLSLLLITFSINFISDVLLRKSWKRK